MAGTAVKTKTTLPRTPKVDELHGAARQMLRCVGAYHACEKGWLHCACPLALAIQRLSEAQYALSEYNRRIGKAVPR